MTQNFKGDSKELKMQAVAGPLLDLTDVALNSFYSDGYDCNEFLLMLYDEQRMPFQKLSRLAYIQFIKEALKRFPSAGTFEFYLFILRAIFGDLSEINFELTDPGKISIEVNATSRLEYDLIAREFIDGSYVDYELIDYNFDILTARGLAGIENEYQLGLLFSEILPCGIYPEISLTFYERSVFIGEDGDGIYDVLDNSFNQIIFVEIGA
jgi:hypothetical protein